MSRHPLAAVAALSALCALGANANAQTLDQPMATAWPATQSWTPDAEAQYGQYVATIGRAVRDHRCHTLAGCLNDPRINPLYEPGSRPIRLHADCADTPYTLRAYFAWRHHLPFAWSRDMSGRGHDRRYLTGAHPVGMTVWNQFATPRRVLEDIGSQVHSGYFRTAPDVENSDTYQASIAPGSIHPGSMFYDPNGHVLVVYEVRPDGEVMMFDGHPDNSVTHSSLTRRHITGSVGQGGGFRNFRPIEWRDGRIVQASNAQLRDFGGAAPFNRASYRVNNQPVAYEDFVRSRLSDGTPFVPARVTVASAAPRRRAIHLARVHRVPVQRVHDDVYVEPVVATAQR